MLTATYKLDLVPGGIPLVIPVSQYDVNSRVFSLELTSSGGEVSIPISTSAAIRGTKPDGNGFDYAASGITISGDTVTVRITLTAQMTAVAGRVPCEIYLYTGTPPTTANPDGVNYVQLATANFILQVEPAALDKDTLKSESEIRQLVDVIDRTDELLDAAADIETAYADYINKAVFYAEAQTLTDAQKATARENIGAADDDDLTDFENTVNVALAGKADAASIEAALAGKVDVAQGAAQAGKALVVGADGNVTTGDAGIPEAVKTALLDIFNHVAYVDEQGQTLYNALERSLYGVIYPKIQVEYNAQSHVVYTGDTLESLRSYLTVRYYENEGSSGVLVDDYTISGMLVAGTQRIEVTYGQYRDVFTLEVIDIDNMMRLSSNDAVVTYVGGGIEWEEIDGVRYQFINTAYSNYRRVFGFDRGPTKMRDKTSSHAEVNLYPINMPETDDAYLVFTCDYTAPSNVKYAINRVELLNGMWKSVSLGTKTDAGMPVRLSHSSAMYYVLQFNDATSVSQIPTDWTLTITTEGEVS